jgi:hypothetical protein
MVDHDEPEDDEPEASTRRWADRSPRLHGLVTFGLGAAGLGGNVLMITMMGVYWPFVTAGASGLVGVGLWSIVTNHSLLQNQRDVPRWWKNGMWVALVAGCVLGYFATHG